MGGDNLAWKPQYNAGDVVGPYTLIEYLGKSKWKCKCNICNFITDVFTANMKRQRMCKNCRRLLNAQSKIDLTNKRFTRLVAKKYIGNGKWECICDCGNTTTALTHRLLNGHIRSCGCLVSDTAHEQFFKDLTGTTVGKITFEQRIEDYVSPGGQHLTQYRCLCDCGTRFNAIACNVLRGGTKSCGCIGCSYGEYYIRQTLNKLKINYITEFSFPDLKSPNGGLLRFDFALFNNNNTLNRLIEFQGEQHFYKPERKTNFGRFTREVTDPIKEEYCKTNNIILEKIRFDENIEEALDKIINKYIASQSRAKLEEIQEGVTIIP